MGRSRLGLVLTAGLALVGCVPAPSPATDQVAPSAYEARTAKGDEVRAKNATVTAAVPSFVRACTETMARGLPAGRAVLENSPFILTDQSGTSVTFSNSDKPLDAFGANAVELNLSKRDCTISYYRGDTNSMVARFSAALRPLGFHEGKTERTTRGKRVDTFIRDGIEVGFAAILSPGGPNRLMLVRVN